MMTESQLKKAAYALCKLRGLDPEVEVNDPRPVYHPDGMCLDSLCTNTIQRWALVQEEIKKHLEIQDAIDSTEH